MGIDARMFVRVQGRDNWLSEAQVLRLSYDLCDAVGQDAFLLMDPSLPPWESCTEKRHALSIIRPMTAELCEEYGENTALAGKVVYMQDGDPIVAADDEQFIEVNLMTRYYGPGYERGSVPTLLAVAMWLKHRLPAGTVWYGGDSSGVCAEPMNVEALVGHWVASGRAPYAGAFGSKGPSCDFCGGVPMNSSGGGGDCSFYRCGGCGKQAVTSRDQIKWGSARDDIFSMARELRA